MRGSGFNSGRYTLFEFGSLVGGLGDLFLNPLDGNFLGTLALDGNTIVLNAASAEDLTFWNGSTFAPTGAVVGGSGTWNLVSGNFTENDGAASGAWAGNGFNAVFAGTGGTVTIGADTTVAPSGLAFLVDGYTIEGGNAASRLELTGATGIDTAAAVGATINAVISGAGSLTKTGGGTLTLSGTNTYSGSTSVLGGTLVNSGTITGAVANNATLTSTGSLLNGLTNSAGAVANLAGTINGQINNSGTVNVTGNLATTNNFNFINSDAGLLNVSGGNYTGANALINNSTAVGGIKVSSGRTLGAAIIVNGATSSILNAGTITTSNRIDNSGTLTTTGTINGGSTGLRGLAGSTTNASGTINGAVSNAGTFNVTGNLVTNTGFTNTGTLNLTGASLTTVTLFNNAGGTTNAAGTLNGAVQNVGIFNVTGNLINGNSTSFLNTGAGVLNVSGGDYTGLTAVINNSTAVGGVNVSAGRTLSAQIVSIGATSSILNAGTITTSNRLDNNGSLTSTGTINGVFFNNAGATASLQGSVNGAVTNSGTVTVTGGLTVNGAVMQNSAGTFNLGGFTTNFGSLAGSGTVNLGAGTLTVGGNGTSTSFDGAIGGTGGLVKTGAGTFTLAGNHGYTGQTRIDEGTLALFTGSVIAGQVRNSGTFNNSGTVINNGTVNTDVTNGSGNVAGTITNNGTWNGTLSQGLGSVANNGRWNGNFLLDAGAQITNTGTWDTTSPFSSVVRDGAFDNTGNLIGRGFAVTGANALLNNDTTGTITLNAGQALNIDTGGRIDNFGTASADANINAGGILRNFAGASWTGPVTIAATGSVSNAGTLNSNVANAGTFASTGTVGGNFNNGPNALTTLAGALNGNISNSGRIQLVGTTTGINFLFHGASGTFELGGFDTTIGGLQGSGTVSLGTGMLTTGGNGSSGTFSGLITGSGNLRKRGTGTFTLSGTSASSGEIVVDEGTFAVASGAQVAGVVRNNATFSNAGTINGGILNRGNLTSSGTLNGGLTQFASSNATVSGTLNGSITSDGTLIVNGNLSSNGFLVNSGAGSVQVRTGTRWTGLTGIDNASAANPGFVIAGELVTSGIVTNREVATLNIGGTGTLTALAIGNFGAMTNFGTVNSNVATFGSITNIGTWNGAVDVAAGGLVTNTGTITGGVFNSGTLTTTGTINTDASELTTFAGSTTNAAGTIIGRVGNQGTFNVTGDLTINGPLVNFGGTFNLTGVTLTASLLNNRAGATINAAGTVNGQVTNSGTFNVTGNFASNNSFANTGARTLNVAGGDFTGLVPILNASSAMNGINVSQGRMLGAQIITNFAGASIRNAGTITVSNLIDNSGILTSTGIVNGLLVNQQGAAARLSGQHNGDIVNSGLITLTNAIAGIGVLEQNATGVFDLAGFDTTIGGLQGTGRVLLADGSLTVNTATASTTFGGEISGSGELIKTGSLALVLDGANSFTGLTTVNQGSLVVGTTGSLAGSVLNNATFMNGGTIGGSVTNFGSFLNAGRILGALTNTGSVQLAGQIYGSVINNGSITNVGGAIVLGRFMQGEDGSLDLAGFNSSFGSLAGGGTLALGSAFLTVGGDNSSSTFDGVIGGTGGLVKIGTGTFTLTAANTYTGTTFVDAGTLVVGEDGVVAPPPSATIAPVVAAVAVTAQAIEPAIASAPAQVGRGLLVGGTGSLTGGRTSVTLEPAASLASVETAPVIAAVAGEAPVAPQVSIAAQTAMLSPAVIAGSVVNSATLINNGTILGTVINNAGASASNHGVIAGAVRNDGTLVSTGTLGGGLANNGQAQIEGVLDGDVLNTGTITLTDITTGIDIFEQAAGGTINLAGFDTTIGVIVGAGSIVLGDATLTTGTDGFDSPFSGVISGTGALNKVSNGQLVLTGANTPTGGTTIAGGSIQLGNGGTTGSIVGPVVNNGALIVNRGDAHTFAGAISGTGMFVQNVTGTTTLTAANTYSGGTLISRGRLVGNTISLQGQIQNNAALEFAQGANGIFAGQLFGTGLFDKTGLGLLELTGNSNGFTGGTFVRRGELRVSGLLAHSIVTVLSGSTLSGSGTIGGLIANSGSTIAPGANGAGTLGVNGAINLQAGSTLQLQIRAGGPSDALVGNGTATLGGTAAFTNLGGAYAFGSEIVLVQADGGRSGTFAGATGLSGFGILYRPELVYTATQARLRFAPNLLANIVGTTALTANQRSVVNRIDGAVTAGYNPQALFNIYALPTAQLPGAFDQLSGEVYASAAGVGIEQERLLREAVLGRVNAVAMAARGDAAAGSGAGAWAQVFGGGGQGDSDGNAARIESDRTGFATGIDFGRANENGSWRAGVFGMQIQSDVTIDARGSSAEVEQSGGGVYASLSTGGFTATLGGYLTSVDLTASRTIALPGFAEVNNGATGGEARQAFAEVSFTIPSGKGMVRPFLGATIGSFDLDAFTESGGAAALTAAEQSYSTGTLTAGVDGSMPVGRSITLFGTLAGRAQLGDRDPQALLALAAAPQQGFAVAGVQLDDVALAARLDASVKLGKNVDFSVGYTGLIGSTISDHGARATLQVQF